MRRLERSRRWPSSSAPPDQLPASSFSSRPGATSWSWPKSVASPRGSSSSSSVLAEAVRAGTAPAAILLGETELILAIGAAVAEELYGRQVPILQVPEEQLAAIVDGTQVLIGQEGMVTIAKPG